MILSTEKISDREMCEKGLISDYDWHQYVWGWFNQKCEQNREFLFRVFDRNGYKQIISLSKEKPLNNNEWLNIDLDKSFNTERVYDFNIKVNPIKQIKTEGVKRSKKVGLYKDDDIVEWVKQKGGKNGFQVMKFQILENKMNYSKKKSCKIAIRGICLEGRLKITDVECFKKMYCDGLGSAKSFGYGLMLIK